MAGALRVLFAKGTHFRPLTRLFSTEEYSKTSANLRLESYEFSHESIFTEEHAELRTSLNKLIEKEINPFVDEWENAKSFPAHEVFKKLGSAGFFGVNKPAKYGGLGLDYSFSVAMAEELGQNLYFYFVFVYPWPSNFNIGLSLPWVKEPAKLTSDLKQITTKTAKNKERSSSIKQENNNSKTKKSFTGSYTELLNPKYWPNNIMVFIHEHYIPGPS